MAGKNTAVFGIYATREAKEVLRDTGGEEIASAGEAAADFSKSDKPLRRAAGTL
jgi:hypothetical protein